MQSPPAIENFPIAASAPLSKIGEQHVPLFVVIQEALRSRILSGEFSTGHRLIEGHLSAEMGVSRIPIREALRALAAEGLVTIEPRRGASVALLSDQLAREMVEVRATLEGLNAKLAAQRRDDKMIAELKYVLELGNSAVNGGRVETFVELNSRFHELLAQVGANSVLSDVMRSLRARTGLLFAPANVKRARQNWDEHAQILQAVIAGNADLAALLATQHIYNSAQAYAESRI